MLTGGCAVGLAFLQRCLPLMMTEPPCVLAGGRRRRIGGAEEGGREAVLWD